jgi:hypothetical protein
MTKIDNTAIFPTDSTSVSWAKNTGIPTLQASTYPPSSLNTPGSNMPIPAAPTNLSTSLSTLGGDDWVGRSSGFPREFEDTCKNLFRQMFRVYAHLYWSHFIEPFYHMKLEQPLNSCFTHFILVSREFDMLEPREIETMQSLVDMWAASGVFPPGSKAQAGANLEAGRYLLALGGVQAK